ncbi:PREDICTED: dirigent protein 15 [Tarenaya hassleriana]|uniref:dirigent protein 15 n=1 Tax=Tarenaya hassleriana TaxID=28532 RepID=UPI00053C712F|nr:PREDICTED: dirigent protein 15 [Tarenaya hassleriana]
MHRAMKAGKAIMIVAMCLAVAAETVHSESSYYSTTKAAKVMKEKMTRVHFYLHDILSGPDPSAVRIAHANVTAAEDSPVGFGSLFAIDDPMTVGPEAGSKGVGNARGMYVSSSKDMKNFTIVMYVDFGFTTGRFNGSSFSVFSRNPVGDGAPVREVAVVGGRGRFRMARGFAKIRTHHIDMKTGDAILRYDVTLIHY